MALNKITDGQLSTYGVIAAPDRLTGDANQNKLVFDRLIRSVVAVHFNALIDALTATTGAGEIGASVDGIDEDKVLGVLAALKALRDSDSSAQGATNANLQAEIDNRYTKAQTDALVGAKFDTVTANELVKSITFDSDNGVFTITTQGGAVTTIDTLLEKVPANFALENNQLVLTLEDGTKQTADLSAFIDTYTFTNGGTIIFSQTGKDITAEVKDGSLALGKLTSEAQATLASYATRAEAAQEKAEAAQTAAEAAKTTAQSAATAATTKANEASASATQAKNSQTSAASAQSGAVTAQGRAETAADEAEASAALAKKYAEEAGQAAGGDFATKGELATAVSEAAADATAKANAAEANAKAASDPKGSAATAKAEAIAASDPKGSAATVQRNLDNHAGNTEKHITDAERTTWNDKANKSNTFNLVLAAASWVDNTYTLAVEGVTPNGDGESEQKVIPGLEITEDELKALQAANLIDAGQAAGVITLKAVGKVPEVDIPVRVIVRGEA